jgi:hypothetical protein
MSLLHLDDRPRAMLKINKYTASRFLQSQSLKVKEGMQVKDSILSNPEKKLNALKNASIIKIRIPTNSEHDLLCSIIGCSASLTVETTTNLINPLHIMLEIYFVTMV